jgi:hypothetical protein
MSFLTTVRATGELFDAITDLGADKKLTGDAQFPLQPMSFYEGNHLKGSVPSPAIVHIEHAVYAVFRGDELARYPGTGRPLPSMKRIPVASLSPEEQGHGVDTGGRICEPRCDPATKAAPFRGFPVVPVSKESWPPKLFEKSTKEHQVGFRRCTACDRDYPPEPHQGCPLRTGLYHTETFSEEPQDLSAFSVTAISDGEKPLRLPTPESVTTVTLTLCDKCGAEL